jgi:type IV pilus secretin PilQ/predicted competence protein
MYRYLVLLGLCATMTVGIMTPVGARAARADVATLKRIASRVDGRAGVITIEASAPVPYVATQPDPRSFVVEMRDIVATGFADGFSADPRSPIADVQVESTHAEDGSNVARIRLSLSQPMRPRVRSARNVIYVEAETPENAETVAATRVNGPSSVIKDLNVSRRGTATAVALLGSGPITPLRIETAKDNPRRLVLSFANVSTALANTTNIGQGPVDRVSIGLDPKTPLVTQVVMELSRTAPYRIERADDGQSLTVVFDDSAAVQMANVGMARSTIPQAAARAGAMAAQAPAVPAGPTPQPAPQTPAIPGQGAQTGAPARYTGHPVSLDFAGSDLRAVLRTFSEISGLNIVIDPTIQGTVDLKLTDVPWDQALDIILRANKLGYTVEGTIVRIAPLAVLADEESQRRKLTEEQALAGELRVLTRALSYARAEDLRQMLTQTVLSQRGSVQTDARTNTLIINDLADRLTRANELLNTLDVPQPQVEIEARIVQTTREFARNIGVQWGFGGRASTALGNTLPLSFPNQGSLTGRAGELQGPSSPDPGDNAANTAVNLGVGAATSAIGLAMGSINGALNLDVALSALERQGQGRILSTPRVSTQNNVAAEITQGVQIPLQTVANNTVTVTFRDAALTLKVTPQITAAKTVIMAITVENSAPDFSRAIRDIPPIDTQRAVTQVLVSDGETTVIGGIYVSRQQASQDRTPGLYRLPLLGWLFKRDSLADESRELLIFITPRIQRL